MALNDLVVRLSGGDDAAGHYALALAAALNVKPTAGEPRLSGYVSAGFPAELLDRIRDDAAESARTHLTSFSNLETE